MLDLSRYRLITTSPSCRGLLINRAPSQKSFQLITQDKDLPDLMLVADSQQAKEEWMSFMDYQRSNNVLDKWLERYDLSNEQLPPPPPSSPSITSLSSTSTSTSSVVKSPIDYWQPSSPASPTTTMDMSGLIHSFISRRKSSPALNSRRRSSFTPSTSPLHSIMDSSYDY